MTPTMLRKALARFLPRKDHFAMLGIGALAVGIGLLALLFPWLSSYALLVAWPFLCTFMLISGLLTTAALYRNVAPTPIDGSISTGGRLNEVVLWIFAPFFTFWLIGVLALMASGMILGLIHLYRWLTQSG